MQYLGMLLTSQLRKQIITLASRLEVSFCFCYNHHVACYVVAQYHVVVFWLSFAKSFPLLSLFASVIARSLVNTHIYPCLSLSVLHLRQVRLWSHSVIEIEDGFRRELRWRRVLLHIYKDSCGKVSWFWSCQDDYGIDHHCLLMIQLSWDFL